MPAEYLQAARGFTFIKLIPVLGKGAEMKSSGQDAVRPAEAMTLAASSGPAPRSQTSSPGTKAAWRLIRLAVLGHMLHSRRFYERVAVGAIVLAALARIGRENRARSLARLTAWSKRQAQFLERQAERRGKHLAPES